MIKAKSGWPTPSPFVLLAIFLTLVFLTGGSARADVTSLVILRPAAVLFFGIGLLTLKREQLHTHRLSFGMLAAIFGLVAFQLVPLPYEVWTKLPGRQLLAEIDAAAGVGPQWRPLSMVPQGTENALYSLFVPAAVLCLGAQLSRDDLFKLVPLLLSFAILSGLVGLLQAIGSASSLYFYKVTNFGSAVGLFANRNHQALLLAMTFPLLAAFTSFGVRSPEQASIRKWAVFAVGLVLVPLLLVTGSRAGLALGGVALLLSAFVFQASEITARPKGKASNPWPAYGVVAFGVIGMAALAAALSRSEALDRLITPDTLEQDRLTFWPVIVDMIYAYFPFGSGFGSFPEVYQISEPDNLLKPQYLNHAHNDYLEIIMSGGLPAIIIIFLCAFILIFRMKNILFLNSKSPMKNSIKRLGISFIILILISGIVDYPLRTPIICSIFCVSIIWIFSFNVTSVRGNNGD